MLLYFSRYCLSFSTGLHVFHGKIYWFIGDNEGLRQCPAPSKASQVGQALYGIVRLKPLLVGSSNCRPSSSKRLLKCNSCSPFTSRTHHLRKKPYRRLLRACRLQFLADAVNQHVHVSGTGSCCKRSCLHRSTNLLLRRWCR